MKLSTMNKLIKQYTSSNTKHNNSSLTNDKEKPKKTTKTIQTIYNIPLPNDTSNNFLKNVLIMKPIIAKRNSIL
jgi:hypothetical protein